MVEKLTASRRIFIIANYVVLTSLSLLCLFPLWHVLAVSLSGGAAATAGFVTVWPIDFTWKSYQFVLEKPEFFRAFGITVQRLLLGVAVNVLIAILVAYPLSKESESFRWRTLYAWMIVFTMLFNGGLIPTYLVIRQLGLLDTMWALVLPTSIPAFLIILLLNFFRGLPKELEEAAVMDGAGHWRTLWLIYVPLSLPSIATITVFASVFHWNAWFDGFMYLNRPENFPLQTYLRTVVIQRDVSSLTDIERWKDVSDRTMIGAQVILASLPIIAVYPLLQRFFIKGMILGSVKG
ncbi:carbohydrate ABC transporter permease [Paenibacillus sp.]|uniref:carbohydrate ABC transporter permease n=1 Tax=Paenibacillus sp. TaxID=58172 RepID=UPI002D4ADB30|nr:carbohydrate ABC transporter permease [Paenibacillus sp.]HZG55651.1 carbohydrate ABC transporter permease [Paenibacillus sp.]